MSCAMMRAPHCIQEPAESIELIEFSLAIGELGAHGVYFFGVEGVAGLGARVQYNTVIIMESRVRRPANYFNDNIVDFRSQMVMEGV